MGGVIMSWALVRKNGDEMPYMIYQDAIGRRWRLKGSMKPTPHNPKGLVFMARLVATKKTNYKEVYTREFTPGFFGLKWVDEEDD